MGAMWLAFALFALCSAQIPPEYASNITVYHINPVSAGVIPRNMNTGDIQGDLYFYLGQFLLPVECANVSNQTRSGFDCKNPERIDPHRVVTQVGLEIDSRLTTYSGCNLCNGKSPMSGEPCKEGTYTCDCFSEEEGGVCDPQKVGQQNITERYAPQAANSKCARALQQICGSTLSNASLCQQCVHSNFQRLANETCDHNVLDRFCPSQEFGCTSASPEWSCWYDNLPRKTGGYWYSTQTEGLCNASSPESPCGWKVQSTRSVKDSCLREKLMTSVEAQSPACFNACGPRNATSRCYIFCFFDTLLGPDARHSTSKPLAGMDLKVLEGAWLGAFLPESSGGCEEIDMKRQRIAESGLLVV